MTDHKCASSESYNKRLSIEQQQQQQIFNEAGSLCSSDSVEEENEIEEQSGWPIQHQIPQSQRGKAKTVLVKNNLSTASFPVRFFIQLSSQMVHMSCDFLLVYQKLN